MVFTWDSYSTRYSLPATNPADGSFNFTSGDIQVDSFEGDLLNGGGVLAPDPDAGRTEMSGSYTQQSEAVLALEITGRRAKRTM